MLLEDFTMMVKGIWAIPLNVPGAILHRDCKLKLEYVKDSKKLLISGKGKS
ncbi:conserved hypothetical protein [Ricinus communis]|uniref:Uncharacterized protein n=1 Tax=Ricinus communis TaxID=3988 RepID=B9S4E9_RICCO|nr:conserved hypothetical protein [Ricinus communis]